jgi:hypothetical protein
MTTTDCALRYLPTYTNHHHFYIIRRFEKAEIGLKEGYEGIVCTSLIALCTPSLSPLIPSVYNTAGRELYSKNVEMAIHAALATQQH